MSEIIEHPDAGSLKEPERLVQVGQSHAPVSIKVYQDIYHQITGRTEQIRKRYLDNLLIEFAELEQLHYKIMQLCDVHNVVANTETVSVFHEKERKEEFTSFERFKAYNSNSSSPTGSVVLKYNFSIIPAGLERPQEYVVTLRLVSRVVVSKQLSDDALPFVRARFFGLLSTLVAEVTVEYTDYVVARGFLEAFDEWVKGCKATPQSKTLRLLQRYSHRIPDIVQIGVACVATFFALRAVPEVSSTFVAMAQLVILFVGALFVLTRLARMMGGLIEEAIDSFPELSYLKLNKGDEKLIQEACASRPRIYLRLLGGAVGSIVLGVISSRIDRLL